MARTIVGGVEYVVGGWGEYEYERRRITKHKYDKEYINAEDAAKSLLSRTKMSPLRHSAEILYPVLKKYEENIHNLSLDDGVFLPAITSADLKKFIDTNDIKYLADIPEVNADEYVLSAEDEKVANIEKSVLPYVSSIENLQARLSNELSLLASKIESAS